MGARPLSDVEQSKREVLRAAISRRAQLEINLGQSQSAVVKARHLLKVAQNDIAEARAENRQIAKGLADRMLGIATSETPSSGLSLAEAERNLALAEDTLQVLEEHADSTATELHVATEAVRRAGAVIISLQADELAGELVAANERVQHLTVELLGLSHLAQGFGEVPNRPWQITTNVRQALNWTEPQVSGGQDPVRTSKENWKAYYQGLCSDPDAGLDSLPATQKASSSA